MGVQRFGQSPPKVETVIKKPKRIVSREEAKERNLTWYFTGKPCKRGHISTRNFNGFTCHECKRLLNRGQLAPIDEDQARELSYQRWLEDFRKRRAERLEEQRRKCELDLARRLLS